MLRALFLTFTLLTLAACDSSQVVYHSTGVSVQTRQADIAQCDAQAFTQFPVRNETRYTPRRFVPPVQTCNDAGTCTLIPGYFEGGTPYTVDVNRGPRAAGVRACMTAQGYTRVEIPRCEPGTAVRTSPTMPPLAPASCVMQSPIGPEVVTPI